MILMSAVKIVILMSAAILMSVVIIVILMSAVIIVGPQHVHTIANCHLNKDITAH